jgi:sulfatase modifying factor 1
MERANHITQQLFWALGVSLAVGLLASAAGAAITLEMVTVGDPGNVGELSGRADLGTQRLCGAVDYVYQIGKYEVTNAQYRAFLNSVARYGDPFELYSSKSWGIQQTGAGTVGDPYVYGHKNDDPNWENRPVSCVSWYSSLRFINWVQNGQPVAEAGPGVTETGTYTLSDPSSVTGPGSEVHTYYTVAIPDHATLTTPTWVLPTEDEWYKAAYYKGGGTAAGYWDYATQSDTLPDNNPPELDTGNSANYSFIDLDPNTDQYAVGPPYYMTDVGAYGLSESAYGTYDQNGNVDEWNEGQPEAPYRGKRGAGWNYDQYRLPAFERYAGTDADFVGSGTGFRIGVVPEPATFLPVGLGLLLTRRRMSPRRR